MTPAERIAQALARAKVQEAERLAREKAEREVVQAKRRRESARDSRIPARMVRP